MFPPRQKNRRCRGAACLPNRPNGKLCPARLLCTMIDACAAERAKAGRAGFACHWDRPRGDHHKSEEYGRCSKIFWLRQHQTTLLSH